MPEIAPDTPLALAAALADAAAHNHSIGLQGHNSKLAMGGPVAPADVTLQTRGLHRILQYEPADLTVSVEAGLSYRELSTTLATHRQMLPLDPPYADSATIGGLVAANSNGPRRRLYGTARDLVIGMQFATLEGKLVQAGGMVVKNVAGLDMGKLLIGSFGTLAAIAVVNFKVTPMPEREESSLLSFPTIAAALEHRNQVLRGVIHPAAIDVLNPPMSARFGLDGFVLAMQFEGDDAVVARCLREIGGDRAPQGFWPGVREVTTHFSGGAVIRISTKLTGMAAAFDTFAVPAIGRAGNGVSYACFAQASDAAAWIAAHGANFRHVVESGSPQFRAEAVLWQAADSDFAMMKKIKDMFDPRHLLNRGRLFRAI